MEWNYTSPYNWVVIHPHIENKHPWILITSHMDSAAQDWAAHTEDLPEMTAEKRHQATIDYSTNG